MGEFEESVEALQAKLQQYAEQLDQVKEALKVQPDEAALVKLQSDLEEVISLTRDLISFQSQTQAEAAADEKTGEASAAATPPRAAGAAASSTAAAAEPVAPPAAPAAAEKAEPTAATAAAAAGRASASTAPALAAGRFTHSAASDTSVVGRTCIAEYEGKKFYAEILELKKSKQGETVLVEFIGWKNQKEYATHQVQLLTPVAPSAVPPGSEAQAIYSEDGKWYDCVIHEHTCGGYKVTYSDYGNSEEVKFDQVRPRKKKTAAAAEAARRRIKEIITPGGYKIPHYLALKPSDTEAQRNSKKRRIKAIKMQQQQEKAEEEAQERARTWQKFNKRAVNKRMAGFISGRGHESMFSGFEVKSTVSINVLGSQRTRANSFIPRRKHDVDVETLQDD